MENKWFTESICHLKNTSLQVFLGTLGCSTFVYLSLMDSNTPYALNWWISLCTVTTVNYILLHTMDKINFIKKRGYNFQISLYWPCIAIGWLHWAYLSVIIFPHASTQAQTFIAIVIAGVASATVSIYLSVGKIMRSAVLAFLVPFSFGAYISQQQNSELLSAITLVYALILLRSGNLLHQTLKNEHTLAKQNSALVEELESKTLDLISNAKRAMMGDMASGMAHEMNNPLMTIILNMEMMEQLIKHPGNNDKLQSNIQIVKKNVDRLAGITKSLSYFFRTNPQHDSSHIYLSDVIQQTISLHSEKILQENISVVTDCIPHLTKIQCRPNEIIQAVSHVFANAIDACAQSSGERWIRIEATEWSDSIEIRIIDSGHGVLAKMQDKIMNPFFTTKDVGKGLGLGLSIALSILRNYGGSLRHESQCASTTFTIYLPNLKDQINKVA
jgi:C4-dicarboxylate-specific signal transduction histidine kinase